VVGSLAHLEQTSIAGPAAVFADRLGDDLGAGVRSAASPPCLLHPGVGPAGKADRQSRRAPSAPS
jgi:hypothetical protein